VGTFVEGNLKTAQGQDELWTGVLTTLLSLFIAGIAIWFISRQIHSLPLINRLILHTELKEGDGSAAGGGLLEAMSAPAAALRAGDLGVAETDLRPAGRALFNGRLLDVQSLGAFVEKGTPVRVVSVGRFVIEVEEAGS
jgi:membrane-bound serine protease (ClpP class)